VSKRFVPLVIFGVFAVVLYFLIEDFVQQMIVKPVLHVAWLVVFVLENLPQALFWLAFIIIAIIIARKSFARSSANRSSGQQTPVVHHGPVATWSGLLERAQTRDFSRWRLAQAMRSLTRDVLTPNQDLGAEQLEATDDRPVIVLPAEIEAYFSAPVPRYKRFGWLRVRSRGTEASQGLDLDPERVVEYLENEIDPLRGE
jgi:hypothetical protein